MAHPGEVIEHPVFRHRARFVRTAADTNGELLELEFTIDPGGPRLSPHIHRLQLEQFEMLDGSLQFSIRGRRLDRTRGEHLDVQPGTSHSFHNVSSAPATFRVMYRPALRLEDFFSALYALGAAGKTNRSGLPSPLWLATLISEFPEEFFYLPVIPWWLQRALTAPLALVGRLLGYSSAKLI
jgi:mannose-6-phosphate isomerase-like protein (cupin superfamily)